VPDFTMSLSGIDLQHIACRIQYFIMNVVNRNGIESGILTCGIRRYIERHIFILNVI